MTKIKPNFIALLLGTALATTSVPAFAQSDSTSVEISDELGDIMDMDFEALMNMEVTSVSKKAERLQDVPSGIYVVTSDDIDKLGATNLHEVLMTVPGYWGTQEGYNDAIGTIRYSHSGEGAVGSVLYLLDGTPLNELMGGSFNFRNLDIPLDEIDRIEIIKGSGGTIYGANSATGVVNIFTKKADSFKGIHVNAAGATPGYGQLSVRGGGKVGEKLSLSGYAKGRKMSGYNSVAELDGDKITVPKTKGTGDTTLTNRLTDDYLSSLALSAGVKADLKLSEKTKISLGTHFNTIKQNVYTLSYDRETAYGTDTLYSNTPTMNRFTNNLRLDHQFSDKHSLFVRWSGNREQDFERVAGGAKTTNYIQDIEVQDNISLGFNDLSVGMNYRFVSINVFDANDPNAYSYVNPQSKESLKGAFIQDKISLLDGKLNFILGIKGENYSLVNNKFYASPMAKFSVMPTENLTIWGGYTKSYTTPGFNQTNIDLTFFSGPAFNVAYGQGLQSTYQQFYEGALKQGATPEEATAAAQQGVSDPAVQGQIAAGATQFASQYPGGYYNISVKNGSETKPTEFQNIELGIRASIAKKLSLETNVFYTIIDDGISASDNEVYTAINMASKPNEQANYYVYGNYVRGNSIGAETVLKFRPNKKLSLEASHSFLQTYLEYKENADWDINTLTEYQKDLTVNNSTGKKNDPTVPNHIIRLKASYEFLPTWTASVNGLYATVYRSSAKYNYETQSYPSILGGSGVAVSENSDRTIMNFKIQKSFKEDQFKVFVFGNDVLNTGRIERTSVLGSVPLFQTHAMYGLGINANF